MPETKGQQSKQGLNQTKAWTSITAEYIDKARATRHACIVEYLVSKLHKRCARSLTLPGSALLTYIQELRLVQRLAHVREPTNQTRTHQRARRELVARMLQSRGRILIKNLNNQSYCHCLERPTKRVPSGLHANKSLSLRRPAPEAPVEHLKPRSIGMFLCQHCGRSKNPT